MPGPRSAHDRDRVDVSIRLRGGHRHDRVRSAVDRPHAAATDRHLDHLRSLRSAAEADGDRHHRLSRPCPQMGGRRSAAPGDRHMFTVVSHHRNANVDMATYRPRCRARSGRRKAVRSVVVRTGEVTGSAFLVPRSWHKGVTGFVTDFSRLCSARPALHNAQAAASSLTGARLHREAVGRFLVAHAGTGRPRRA